MQSEEQRLIDGLFSRLQQAQTQSAPRDATAESLIAQHVQAQPAAPYYMAQTILIQEAAIKQLHERIQALESDVAQLQSTKQSSGGFLAGLFGGSQSQPRVNDPIPGAQNYGRAGMQPQAGYAQPQTQNSAPGRSGGGFMAGALQTAAGVAGGVVLGNMLMNMFSGSHPQEIVNIIDEQPPAPVPDDLNQATDAQFLPDDGTDYAANGNDDWSNNDFSNDDFGGDDDSWV